MGAIMEYAALVSGGVDSSVALARLVKRGEGPVRAYYLKIWLEDEASFLGDCPWEEDLEYARSVTTALGVPLEVVPMQEEYYRRVVSYTLEELRAGRTPSPDIFCNQRIKFGAFYDAIGGEADRIATGHYAGVDRSDDGVGRLRMAADRTKDQTYFLSHLSQEQLRRCEFPLAELQKQEVRDYARAQGFANMDRPDSQGICFLGRIRYSDFVRHYLGERDGAIIEHESDRELGHHTGAWFYTIGQRQGLGLGNGPWYVVQRDVESNIVRVSHGEHVAEQARSSFEIAAIHAIAGSIKPGRYATKIRHGPDLIGCRLESTADPDRLRVILDRPDRGIAAGQFAVIYDPPYCLGAGMIQEELE